VGTPSHGARLADSAPANVTPSVQASLERVLNEIGTPAPGPGGTLRFQVLEIGCHTGHFAGRDSTGQPCLLINSYDATTRAPIRLAAVEVRFSVICLIVTANGAETKQKLTAIICTAHDKQIQSYFAHVAEIILKIISTPRSSSDSFHNRAIW
jgi:hypothetical protein